MKGNKPKPALKNDMERKAYVKDQSNWEDVGELEEARCNPKAEA